MLNHYPSSYNAKACYLEGSHVAVLGHDSCIILNVFFQVQDENQLHFAIVCVSPMLP